MVIVAERSAPDVLGAAVKVTVPSPTLDCGSAVSHVAEDVTRQYVLDVTDRTVDEVKDDTVDTFSVGTRDAPLAGCVTVTVAVSTEPEVVVTVTVAVRAAPVLAVADNVTDRVPDPDAGLMVTQLASEVACQLAFEVTKRVLDMAVEVGIAHNGTDSDSVDVDVDVPGWVTATVRVTALPPEVVVTVTVADLAEVDVFAAACKLRDPLPEPEVGLTVSQVALDDALHVVLDVTDTEVEAEFEEGTVQDDIDSVSDGVTTVAPGWFTETVRVTALPPEVVVTVTVADLAEVDVLAAACSVKEPLPEPEAGLTVSQVALDEALQVVFDVTVTDVESEFDEATVQDDIDSVSDGVTTVAPGWFTETVRVTAVPPEVVVTVTVADLAEVDVLAAACKLKVPFPELEVGLTVSHVALDDALQVVFDVTVTDVEAEFEEGTVHDDVDSVNDGVTTVVPG
ncbi:MAG: hypothetical protein FWD63_02685 [Propionibacteriaceae bacterium]|nr:hypothetical protein [Propionibacteriaceae bacterium]